MKVDLTKPNRRTLMLDDKLTFGKYKGERVRDIIKEDADYLLWIQDNVEWCELDERVLRLAEQNSNRGRRDRQSYDDRERDTYDGFQPRRRGRFGDYE
jgi:hypothetical protein